MAAFPAPVLPMHREFVGVRVIAFAHAAELIVVSGQDAAYEAHREFFAGARRFADVTMDIYLLVQGEEASVWTQAHTERTAAGWQHGFVGMTPDQAALAKRRAGAPLKSGKPQQPCDHGLFSDAAAQSDLVEQARKR